MNAAINKKGVDLGIVVIAALIIGLVVFTIIVTVFNISVTGSLNDLFSAFRASSGSEMSVQGMLYQCEVKCVSLDLKFDSNSIKKAPFCTYAVQIEKKTNHCYNDFSNDPVNFVCKAHLSDGTEVTVSCA